MSSYYPCRTCGHPVQGRKNAQCRPCYDKERASHSPKCVRCGKPFPDQHRQRRKTNLCKDCWNNANTRQVRHCIDCTSELPVGSLGERCWACHTKHRAQEAANRICEVADCNKKAVAGGLCRNHYMSQRRVRISKNTADIRKQIRPLPCAVCGFNALSSHIHRFIPEKDGGLYEISNVVPLCARCHEMVHHKLIPCPLPPLA